jgi:hypothetical protein
MRAARLRTALALKGLTPATTLPEASAGRADEATIQPAELIEGDAVAWRDVGPAEPCPEPLAFLDGVQRVEPLVYAGSSPIVLVEAAAAVRERRGRELGTAVVERAEVVVGRASALAEAGDAIAGFRTAAIPEDAPPHPVRDMIAAGRVADRIRGELELRAGTRFRDRSAAWLVVDGSLAESPAWAADARMLGVAKSHATLPFDGADLARYLRLPSGHRSSLFQPRSRSVAPVRAFALRLWPWEGKDLLYGLVRIEVAPANGTPATADRIARWVLAERAPISAPDRRWDRLLYGIHSVEEYLRASR